MTELVRGYHGALEYVTTLVDVVRPGIGECLEKSECSNQFADTADILAIVTAVFRIARVLHVGQVEHGNTVLTGILTKHAHDLPAKGRVRVRQIHVAVIEQAQVDLGSRQRRARWLLAARDGALFHHAHTLDATDTGIFITVDRVGLHGRCGAQCYE